MKSKFLVGAITFCILTNIVYDAKAVKTSVATYGMLQATAIVGSQTEKINKRVRYMNCMGSLTFKAAAHAPKAKTTFSANFDLSADMSTVAQSMPIYNSVYVSATGPFGNVKLGNIFTAAMSNYIDGTSLMGGDSGIFGVGLMNSFNPSAYAMITTGVFYDPGFATSISYESPNLNGFHFSASYTPNSQSLGLMPPSDDNNRHSGGGIETPKFDTNNTQIFCNGEIDGDITPCGLTQQHEDKAHIIATDLMAYGEGGFTKDVMTAAVWYEGGVPHHWNYSVAAAYWTGKSNFAQKFSNKNINIRNLNAYSVGFKIGFKHIKFGAGFVDELKSCLPKEFGKGENEFKEGANAGRKFTAVLSYIAIPNKLKLSLGGLTGTRCMSDEKEDKVTTYGGSFAIDYIPTNGVTVFCGINHAQTKTCDRAIKIAEASGAAQAFKNNKITYVTIGSKISF